MATVDDLVAAIRRNPKNVRYGDLCRVWTTIWPAAPVYPERQRRGWEKYGKCLC